ncbi:S8 family serine peptidase [Sphingomonas sp. S2-65]|uniref:S8 family serine peptidase n=1 Tax=Sphingomonas sp. S2-65 TaxID=2903960 RepID=UPI001F367C21|nr:S8 family serine peptidase [Sphingomonas sp. S2-65]UYY58017.1 S8 family serine peptidase [Sphingomonas sp. S2-65]
MLLAACGSGGGGVNSPGTNPAPPAAPAPTPAPPQTPTPSPAPAPTQSAEYLASGAAVGMKADAAYAKGLTGKGVTIAVVDTGIDLNGGEFAGRISPDSRSFDVRIARCPNCAPETASFPLDDVQGHGSGTAAIAAAAKNGSGMHGVAYESTIIALKIANPDLSGVTEGSTSPIREGQGGNAAAIAPAILHGADKGAFVFTMSLNGVATGQIATEHKLAMDVVRAKNLLFVESVSNNVGEDSFKGQLAENLVGSDLSNKDWFLFGIRVDANLQPPPGNGTPGALADRTLAVVASNIQTVDQNGAATTVTGNSFAAPAIAGAAALLKQNWPQLGGREISRILLDTARDLGVAGVDEIYGAGLLDLDNALKAQAPALTTGLGTAALAGSSLSFPSVFGAGSAGGLNAAVSNVVVMDRYGRDYRANLGGIASAQAAAPRGILVGGLLRPIPAAWQPAPINQSGVLGLAADPSGLVGGQVARPTQSGAFAFRTSADSYVTGRVGGSIERSGLATGAMLRPLGIATDGSDVAFVRDGWSIGFAAAQSRRSRRAPSTDATYGGVTVTSPEGFTIGLASNRERGSALGLRGSGAFAIAGGSTTMLTLGWSRSLAGMILTGEAVGGATSVDTGSPVMRFDGPILSSGFRFQADAPALGGIGTFGMTSPLRVDRARMRLTVPTAYDWHAGSISSDARRLDLAPGSREMNFELVWGTAIARDGWLRFGFAHAISAGNVRGVSDTAGFATLTLR